MSRHTRKSSQQPRNGSRKKTCSAATTASCRPPTDIVLEKQHLAKLALQNTSCAGCIASVRALLGRPLSELRMLKAVVDEHGSSALRLKDAYLNNPKRTEQLLDTFPMSSVLKKVKPVGSGQRCQLHRRSQAGVGPGGVSCGFRGAEVSGRGIGGAGGLPEPWDWEDAWERMPPNLRCEVATIKAPALEAAIHHATDANRFCSDCKHNVVQAHDILMGKVDLEGCENEEEFDEVLKLYKERGVFDSEGEMFQPFEDRVFDGESGSSEDKVLVCDVMDVEDLIYFYEDFSSQDLDNSSSGQQRHAATLEQGQREVRSVLGAVLLNQLRSVWHAQTAQVQGEQYLFCLVVDAIRTMLASHGAAPDGDDLMVAIDAEERCAAEERRQKRRQKRKERKRAGKAQLTAGATPAPGNATSRTSKGGAGVGVGAGDGHGGKVPPTSAMAKTKAKSAVDAIVEARGPHGGVLSRRSDNGGEAAPVSAHRKRQVCPADCPCVPDPGDVKAEREGATGLEEARARVRAGFPIGSGLADAQAAATAAAAAAAATVSPLGSSSLFGTGGLAFQLGVGQNEDSDGDFETDPDLIMEMEQLKSSVMSRSDIDCLRKTLRQNYDRFISQGTGRVH